MFSLIRVDLIFHNSSNQSIVASGCFVSLGKLADSEGHFRGSVTG